MGVIPQRERVLVGRGGPFFDLDPAAAHLGLQAAVDALPSSGGELFVFPPATPGERYAFAAPVFVNADNVRLRFAPGTTLDFAPGSRADCMVHVRGRGFSCAGLSARHSIDGAVSGRSLVLVEDLGSTSASAAASFTGCRFEVLQNTSEPIEGFSCIRFTGFDRKNRKGMLVEGCTFLAPPGLPQAAAWVGGEPTGVCALRASESQGNVITRNHFLGATESASGNSGPSIYLDACPESIVSSNVFRGLALPISGLGDPRLQSAVLRISTEEQEGHHTLVVGNTFRRIDCENVISASNVNYDSINSNLFCDIGGGTRAAVQASGVLLLVCTNGFHQLALEPGGAVVALDLVRDAVVAGNVFVRTPAESDAVRVALQSYNVHQPAAQVRSSAGV